LSNSIWWRNDPRESYDSVITTKIRRIYSARFFSEGDPKGEQRDVVISEASSFKVIVQKRELAHKLPYSRISYRGHEDATMIERTLEMIKTVQDSVIKAEKEWIGRPPKIIHSQQEYISNI
jgi:hypothetical protein